MGMRAHVVMKGNVQGVFFRANTQEKAKELSVKGWVRNRKDGSVEAVFEGSDSAVKEIVEWCKRGPPGAQVKEVETRELEFKGEFKEFRVLY